MRKNVLALFLAGILLSGCSSYDDPIEPQNSVVTSSNSEYPSDKFIENSSEYSLNIETYIEKLDNGDFVFVDYEFNENPKTITDPSALGSAYEKALAALKSTGAYSVLLERFADTEFFGRFTQDPGNFIDENGVPVPVFKKGITDDFDCDGTKESFLIISIPTINGNEIWFERDLLYCVGKNGAELIDDYYNADIRAVLDYGCCKQLIVSSEGMSSVDSKSNIWGVQGGKAIELYGGRLDYKKVDCFLYSQGPQSIGDFAVYDINKREYLAIQGKPLKTKDVLAMDTTGAFDEYLEQLKNAWQITLLGGKYYILGDGYFEGIPFIYENKAFVKTDKAVRLSLTPGLTGNALNTLEDLNYDQAVASMVKPEQLVNN